MYLVHHHLCLISTSLNTATCFMLLCTSHSTRISPAEFPCIHLSPAIVTCSDSLSALSTLRIASARDWSFLSPLGIADVSVLLLCHIVHPDVSEIPAWNVPTVSRSPWKVIVSPCEGISQHCWKLKDAGKWAESNHPQKYADFRSKPTWEWELTWEHYA